MALTADDVYLMLRDDTVTLAFDTSVTFRPGFLQLCDQANRVDTRREKLGQAERIRLCVPAVAHTETMFHLAQKRRGEYDLEFIHQVLGERRIAVLDFTAGDAERCADLLMQRYETPEQWRTFKKRRCLECAGLPVQYHRYAEGNGEKCGAANDWLIIAQGSQDDMILVMDDKGRGGEYDLVERIARYDDVRDALEQILEQVERDLRAAQSLAAR